MARHLDLARKLRVLRLDCRGGTAALAREGHGTVWRVTLQCVFAGARLQ
jgi:hypothetical protein